MSEFKNRDELGKEVLATREKFFKTGDLADLVASQKAQTAFDKDKSMFGEGIPPECKKAEDQKTKPEINYSIILEQAKVANGALDRAKDEAFASVKSAYSDFDDCYEKYRTGK